MNLDLSMLGIMCVTTLYFLLPAYLSNSGGLIFGGGMPVDFGKSDSNGVRWIGDGVTLRGLIGGTLLGTLVGAIQGYLTNINVWRIYCDSHCSWCPEWCCYRIFTRIWSIGR